ncbi:MAG: sulfur oxidation c-type cytochrome SoxX [Halieaceae bacterium]|jgi:sulfur-oxidizing protein SoxX|nr:sulfur oxidation c-type cytochrome SoxX [Halieaceae bacterium]
MSRALLLLTLGVSVQASALPLQALAEVPGNAARGREAIVDRDRGHCLLCHRIAQIDEGFQGNIGPPLSDVGRRLSAARLRERIVDPTRLNPDTVMPAYHRINGLRQVADEYRGRPILSAQEIEDVVAYLQTLRQAPADKAERSR